MEFTKKVTSGSSSSSSSSFVDLFGPKDSSMPSSSAGHFSSVFGPSSTGLVRDFSPSGYSLPSNNHNSADNKSPKNCGKGGSIHKKDRGTSYQNETVEPCNFSSSIHYGGQEVYSPDIQSKNTPSSFKKDGRDDDSNGSNSNSASRGNWWQGMLFFKNIIEVLDRDSSAVSEVCSPACHRTNC